MQLFTDLGLRSVALARWLARPASLQQRNVRNVLVDGIGVALVQGVATFLSVFLVRLGATPFLVGLLTSMPALTGMILAIPVGRLLERQRDILPWYSRVRVLVLGSYALTGLVPFFFPPEATIIAIIVIWAIATVPQTIVNVAFTMVMSAVAGPNQRYYLMSRRWSIMGVTTAITVALVGVILDMIRFPLNYQVVFIASFAGGMLSFAFSNRIQLPENAPPETTASERHTLRKRLGAGLAAMRENTDYNRFLISQFVFRCGLTLAIPLFPLYWVRELNAPDSWIGVINTVNSAVLMVAYFLWSKVSERRGNSMVLRACAFGLVFYPLLTGLTKDLAPLPIYAGFAGIFAAGIDLVMFDILLDTCPPRHAASYIALYQTTTYVATFLAPTLGTYLADTLGYSSALFVSAGLRLAGALLFVVMGVGARRDKMTR
ncbi:MAG TPA: MFS transporter [Roseiflexaceae bacterium]|nr:MFS transporter [Roseiflexaceae bacterium]